MQAFLFDFDGIIVDSERHWAESDQTFFPSIAPGYDETDVKNMMGLGLQSGYQYLCKRRGLSLSFEEYAKMVETEVDTIYSEKAQLLPGVKALIARVQSLHMHIGIASSSKRKWIETTLKRLDLMHTFPCIATADDVNDLTKPNPAVYLRAAQQLHVAPAACIALEDSDNGITAALDAGMTCIALRTDMNPTQSLTQATKVVQHLDEVTIALLQSLMQSQHPNT